MKNQNKKFAKEKTREMIDHLIMSKTSALIRAGLSLAIGQQFIYKYDVVTKKHILLTNPDEIEEAFNFIQEGGHSVDGNIYLITAKEPDTKAIDMLLNRTYGKPTEKLEVETIINFADSLRNLSLEAMGRIKEVEGNKINDELLIEKKSEGS
jgi:hypothetical protein